MNMFIIIADYLDAFREQDVLFGRKYDFKRRFVCLQHTVTSFSQSDASFVTTQCLIDIGAQQQAYWSITFECLLHTCIINDVTAARLVNNSSKFHVISAYYQTCVASGIPVYTSPPPHHSCIN